MSFGGGGSGSSRISTSADVALSNTADNDLLTYDTTLAKWTNAGAPVASVAGKTGVVTLAESDVINLPADLAGRVQTTGGGLETAVTANSGATYTVNLGNANLFVLTLTNNCTLTLSGATTGKACSVSLMLKQDSTGSRVVTWPGSVKWSGGTAPTLTTTAAKVDFIALLSVDGGTTWYGFTSGLNY